MFKEGASMQAARLDFDLPAILRLVEAIGVQCWWPMMSCRQISNMTSCQPGKPVMTTGSSVTLYNWWQKSASSCAGPVCTKRSSCILMN